MRRVLVSLLGIAGLLVLLGTGAGVWTASHSALSYGDTLVTITAGLTAGALLLAYLAAAVAVAAYFTALKRADLRVSFGAEETQNAIRFLVTLENRGNASARN